MLKFEDSHIVVDSQKDVIAFIKMANDGIVMFELTGNEYDSDSK